MKKILSSIIFSVVLLFFSCKKDNKDENLADLTKKSIADSTATTDIGWPREVNNNGSKLIYYQPQVDQWRDFKQLTADIAFSLTPKDGKEVLGVASLQVETLVDKDSHNVFFKNVEVTDIRFPALDEKQTPQMEKLFKELMPKSGNPIALDRVMAGLSRSHTPAKGVAVKNDPPTIFYSASPSILLIVQGEPVLAPIEKTSLSYVVNTNWDLFFDKPSKKYYLLAENVWLTATDLNGKWTKTQNLPKEMNNLPSGQNFDDVKKMVPAQAINVDLQVFFSNKPAELISVNGAPKFLKIPGTELMYIDNTDNDVFADEKDGQYYVLLSGRWFKSKELTGPWSYATTSLPADFAKIPKNSPRASVLASVPGTEEASDAVMLAQVPTTAVIKKADAEAKAKVNYDGTPQFKPIEGTSLQYASNTQEKVIKVGDMYYLCFQAVWFMSTTPNGPWKVTTSVPKEIYSIPPSSPVYNVTYVTQTNVTDTTVESSTTAGYFGAFIAGAIIGSVLTYGTGFYYPPYFYYGPMYPIYRPWPCTYGVGAVYNPWTGGWAAGRAVYGPYGSAGTSAWYNPATGRYGRSASVQGWYGGRTVAHSYNPWTGNYAATAQGHNAYAQWGHSAATNGRDWVQTGHVTTRQGTAIGYKTSGGNEGVITHHRGGGTTIHTNDNLYAGHDGHVYKKDANGNWSHYNNGNGGWTQAGTLGSAQNSGEKIQRPADKIQNNNLDLQKSDRVLGSPDKPLGEPGRANTIDGLNKSDFARDRGETQTRNFQNFQRSGGLGSGGGLRGGGGGFRRR
ncbi:hypothetical protein IRZ71_04310 [Flavobacterium sp. ANB]|uniref:hypothetical protein n=1 Tax=unclassified Flavobacterium TaxID=196869 RepID=UPI0012B6EEB7|nr:MULTISPECIES: hypothetical protein [unclassified Flavobacterium]MBF4515549.1 hypothetical protein [Flavobacterium sp. ANB]MTD68552.1 hypothetical protein [Flavobacterium sp. LC2016-13]